VVDHDNSPRRANEALLSILLAGLAAAGFLLFMIVITGGYFIFLVAALAALAFIALFHYLLWGHAMEEQVADDLQNSLAAPLTEGETEAEAWLIDDQRQTRRL
jgi:hypothetical protein